MIGGNVIQDSYFRKYSRWSFSKNVIESQATKSSINNARALVYKSESLIAKFIEKKVHLTRNIYKTEWSDQKKMTLF